MKLTRRETLTLAAAATAAGVIGLPSLASAKDGDTIDLLKLMATAIPDKVSGSPDAKVTLIEYASPTCPHCAAFSNDTLGPFMDKYVKTGKVKFIIRPFARNTMDAAIFMLAEAAAKAADGAAPADTSASSSEAPADTTAQTSFSEAAVTAYENVLSTFYRTQDTWGTSDKPLDAVKAVAFQLGFSEASFQEALTNQELFTAIETMRNQALNDFGLEGTPTFYLNGKTITGAKTLDEMSAEIDPLL